MKNSMLFLINNDFIFRKTFKKDIRFYKIIRYLHFLPIRKMITRYPHLYRNQQNGNEIRQNLLLLKWISSVTQVLLLTENEYYKLIHGTLFTILNHQNEDISSSFSLLLLLLLVSSWLATLS